MLNLIRKVYKPKHVATPSPILIMTILAKNEIDIIEKQLIFHKAMGVDGFIVTDNNSTDGTEEVFEKYYKKGWIKKIIIEPKDDYSQAEWVDRMIKTARDEFNADWVINADADEFWVSKSGNLKNEIAKTNRNVLYCPIFNILPLNEKHFFKNDLMIIKKIKPEKYELSKFNIFGISIPKVVHRTLGYCEIKMGNHDVAMHKKSSAMSKDIVIYHFNIRSKTHFINKMMTGGAAYANNKVLGKNVGAHWRYFYDGFKSGALNLDQEYEKFIGRQYWKTFVENGVFTKANEVKNFFDND